jgi:hypothetical protein
MEGTGTPVEEEIVQTPVEVRASQVSPAGISNDRTPEQVARQIGVAIAMVRATSLAVRVARNERAALRRRN